MSNHAETARDYLRQYEELNEEIADIKLRAREDISELRAKQKCILVEAKKDDISPKALKAVAKRRQIKRQILNLEDEVPAQDVGQFHQLCEAFANSAFGTWLSEREPRGHHEPVPTHA